MHEIWWFDSGYFRHNNMKPPYSIPLRECCRFLKVTQNLQIYRAQEQLKQPVNARKNQRFNNVQNTSLIINFFKKLFTSP